MPINGGPPSQLETAVRHVREAHRRIEEQVALIEQLADGGHDTSSAEQLLGVYLSVLDQLTAHLETLQRPSGSRTAAWRRALEKPYAEGK
jgi:hypothetical protein